MSVYSNEDRDQDLQVLFQQIQAQDTTDALAGFVFDIGEQGWKRTITDNTGNNTRDEYITFSFRGYEPWGFYFEGFSLDVVYKSVEDLIAPMVDKYDLDDVGYTFLEGFDPLNGVDYQLLNNTEVTSHEVFADTVGPELRKIFISPGGIIDFLNDYSSLEALADLIAPMQLPEEIVIHIQGPTLYLKGMTILKLTEHSDFNTIKGTYRSELVSDLDRNEEAYRPLLSAFDELFDI